MEQPLEFTKMHGLGNDFILIDNWSGQAAHPAALAKALCQRRLSAGADGLILAEPSEKADARMHFFNADGSEAEMCGNGIRCFARFLHDQGLVRGEHMRIETLAGIMQPELVLRQDEVVGVKVDMGLPEFAPEKENAARMDSSRMRSTRISSTGAIKRGFAFPRVATATSCPCKSSVFTR